jgi:hypothetical protein
MFVFFVALTWLCLHQTMAASSTGDTAGFHASVARQQSVGRPVDFAVPGRDQPVTAVHVLDVVVVDAAWGGKDVEFTLVNQTVQAVTAWYVELDVLYPDGFTARTAIGKDGYAEYEGLRPGSEPSVVVPAHGQVRTRERLPRSPTHPEPVSPPKATVIAAVFADRSTIGHPIAVEQLFARRQQFYDGWAAVVAALEAAESDSADRDKLATALGALETAETERFPRSAGVVDSHALGRLIVANARARLGRGKDGAAKVPPQEILHNSLLQARSELLAIEHHRRPQG